MHLAFRSVEILRHQDNFEALIRPGVLVRLTFHFGRSSAVSVSAIKLSKLDLAFRQTPGAPADAAAALRWRASTQFLF
ncbi:hypothetical protein [Bradyrhizobium zhanjiangense]|uniref:Uncharacterized protein n=1 Tax=Bradyrhizobium zhanjiangense TaxID=1325107 RepID=A0A4Q0SR70_9BRAD|nr:hypothetical protein [Bradyrhizobium zhanjiangense]RXH40416.1 hypothetical protein XH94_13170 [Bradyrhizobium zhanjiangense]